jgi:hypothetical protein
MVMDTGENVKSLQYSALKNERTGSNQSDERRGSNFGGIVESYGEMREKNVMPTLGT